MQEEFINSNIQKLKNTAAVWMVLALSGGSTFAAEASNPTGHWKTAFFKRGQMDNYNISWAGGEGATLRAQVPLYFSGSKVRIWVRSSQVENVQLDKLTLAKAENREGKIEGATYPVTFVGQPSTLIECKQTARPSDEVEVPVSEGLWFLQQSYSSPKTSYSFDVDGFFYAAGDKHDAQTLGEYKKGQFPGNVFQVDVWTTDQRPMVLCYGDSITQGFGATPKSGNRYPELLAAMLKCPTLNLGVNGDMAIYSGGAASMINKLDGVGSVIFLMGINDILNNKSASPEDFMKRVRSFEKELQQKGINFYVGTILPAGGYSKYDDDPAKETLRQSLNQAIRAEMKGGNLIDFDAALCDPGNPARMKPEYQMDYLHPNDAGNRKMAETAAAVLSRAK